MIIHQPTAHPYCRYLDKDTLIEQLRNWLEPPPDKPLSTAMTSWNGEDVSDIADGDGDGHSKKRRKKEVKDPCEPAKPKTG